MEIETIRFLFFGHPLPKSHGAKFIESYSLLKQRSPLNNHQNVAISCHKCALFWYNTFSNKIIKWRRLCLVFWKTFKANKIFRDPWNRPTLPLPMKKKKKLQINLLFHVLRLITILITSTIYSSRLLDVIGEFSRILKPVFYDHVIMALMTNGESEKQVRLRSGLVSNWPIMTRPLPWIGSEWSPPEA